MLNVSFILKHRSFFTGAFNPIYKSGDPPGGGHEPLTPIIRTNKPRGQSGYRRLGGEWKNRRGRRVAGRIRQGFPRGCQTARRHHVRDAPNAHSDTNF